LTTHSLLEADILSDKIGVMVTSKLRCIGTPLHLKNKYGSGYRLTVVANKYCDSKEIETEIEKIFPNAKMLQNDSGSISRSLIKYNVDEISQGLHLLEEKKDWADWTISLSTLEDVFMHVSKKYDFNFHENGEFSKKCSNSSLSL